MHSGHDVKMCRACGVLNRIPDLETRPKVIQCDACGQNISLNDVTNIIHRESWTVLSRRTFNQAIPWLLFLVGPFWNKIVDKIFFYDKEELKRETRAGTGSASAGAVVIGRAKAGEVFSAKVVRPKPVTDGAT